MYYLWIVFYEIIFIIYSSHWGTVFALIGYIGILYHWLKKTGKKQAIAWQKPSPDKLKDCWYGIFLLIFPVWNVFTKQQTASDISYTILLVLVAVVEEIFFRGFLYDMLSKWSQKGYIFLSAFLFGAFHLVNLFEGYPLDYVMIQTLCAFMAGIGYAWVTVKTQSIIPGMVAHILTNISA